MQVRRPCERNEDKGRGKAPYLRSDEGDEAAKKLRGGGRGEWGGYGQGNRVVGEVEWNGVVGFLDPAKPERSHPVILSSIIHTFPFFAPISPSRLGLRFLKNTKNPKNAGLSFNVVGGCRKFADLQGGLSAKTRCLRAKLSEGSRKLSEIIGGDICFLLVSFVALWEQHMARRKSDRGKLITELLLEFPDADSRTLARLLYDRHPGEFSSLEVARSSVRYYRGNIGEKSRNTSRNKALHRKNGKAGQSFRFPAGLKQRKRMMHLREPGYYMIHSDVHVPYQSEIYQ